MYIYEILEKIASEILLLIIIIIGIPLFIGLYMTNTDDWKKTEKKFELLQEYNKHLR